MVVIMLKVYIGLLEALTFLVEGLKPFANIGYKPGL